MAPGGEKKEEEGGGKAGKGSEGNNHLVVEIKRAHAKLLTLKDGYLALNPRKAEADAAVERAREAATEGDAKVDALIARHRAAKTEMENLEAEIADLGERIRRSNDPDEPGISPLESARRALELEKRALTSKREEVSSEIAEARAERDSFAQEKQQLEVLMERLEKQCKELRDTIEEAKESSDRARTMAQRRNDARMRADFDLPADESELASYSCASLIMPGHIIVASSYVLFQSELGTNRRSIHINQIEKVKSVISGLSLKGIEITYDGGRKVSYGNLLDRDSLVKNIRKIASYHRRKVVFEGFGNA